MKTQILTAAIGSFLAFGGAGLAAQDTPPAEVDSETTVTTTTPTMNGNGAEVTREVATTTTTTPNEDGTDTVTTSSQTMQTVDTPSGNTTIVTRTTDEDGERTTAVEHDKTDRPEHPAHSAKPGEEPDDEAGDPETV